MSLRKVLLIAYNYPPITTVGKNRTLRFQRHLASYGYDPIVHTVSNPDPLICKVSDQCGAEAFGHIRRSKAINLSWITAGGDWLFDKACALLKSNAAKNPVRRTILFPDYAVGWIPGCLRASERIISEEHVALVYVSCSPFSAALTGAYLRQRTGLPVVLDFRDPWSFNQNLGLIPSWARKLHQRAERRAICNTDFLVANTRSAADRYRAIYPDKADCIDHIYNTYDYDMTVAGQDQKFLLLYTGIFYGIDYLEMLFGAVARVLAHKNIRIIFTGQANQNVNRTAAKFGISHVVQSHGYLPRQELEVLKSKASYLLFHNGFEGDDEVDPCVIKSKLYDYLATGIPLIAVASQGEVDEIIRRYSPNSHVVPASRQSTLDNALELAYSEWQQGRAIRRDSTDFRRDFSPSELTRKLATIFDKVLSTSRRSVGTC